VLLGLFQVRPESGRELGVLRRFCHFRKGLGQLLLSAPEVLEFVDVKILEGFEFHWISPAVARFRAVGFGIDKGNTGAARLVFTLLAGGPA
jgi:hypothetical protein